MASKIYIVEGRQFRTESDYARAKRDKEIIDKIRSEIDFGDKKQIEDLYVNLRLGRYKFQTLIGQDFLEEVTEQRQKLKMSDDGKGTGKKSASSADRKNGARSGVKNANSGAQNLNKGRGGSTSNTGKSSSVKGKSNYSINEAELQVYIQEELRKREKRRKWMLSICSILAVVCLGYFGIYNYYNYRTENTYKELSDLKDKSASATSSSQSAEKEDGPLFTLDSPTNEPKEILDEYLNLYNKNKKLIGWLKIADTNIDYPVMQTSDNEYYLNHNLNQEYDKNGSIFMDKDCDVQKPSTNFILYGHHMQSGKMFGKLHLYEDEDYYEKHPYIEFDTIYEKGLYEIMYVFRSRVYNESEIVFKYYQFIDANSEQEFNSYMEEMASMSFYDTGVTAEFGDQLLTLSTCDYEETNGRFVVVAKKIAKE